MKENRIRVHEAVGQTSHHSQAEEEVEKIWQGWQAKFFCCAGAPVRSFVHSQERFVLKGVI